MPDTLSGAPGTRTSSSITYALAAGTAALEAMEAGDIYGPEAATDRSALIDRLVVDQGMTVVAACDENSAPCVVGGLPDGTFVAVWAPERSDLLLAAVALVARPSTDEAGGERKAPASPQDALLRSGEVRYAAYVRAERASQAERVRAGDPEGASIHAERIAPALRARSGGPRALARAAADVLSLDARL
ncbi:MAG: hypothetical protein KY439_11630, partial [Actinobacteria bacterium]|nr:hypothetical protein [Actinomycetota bacterium]